MHFIPNQFMEFRCLANILFKKKNIQNWYYEMVGADLDLNWGLKFEHKDKYL